MLKPKQPCNAGLATAWRALQLAMSDKKTESYASGAAYCGHNAVLVMYVVTEGLKPIVSVTTGMTQAQAMASAADAITSQGGVVELVKDTGLH